MEPTERRRIRTRGVLLATVGLFIGLGFLLVAEMNGVATFTYREWAVAAVATFAAQALLLLMPYRGWDERIPWDPHFLYVPMTAAALLLSGYIYLAPVLRVVVLMGWIVALIFTAGTAGFVEVLALSVVMAIGYIAAVWLRMPAAAPLSPAFDGIVVGVFLTIIAYAGVVFERLRDARRELQRIRHRMAELALTDPLTGLPNRRHFEELMHQELDRIRRYGACCTLAMIDVDTFKWYNDSLGHVAGDAVLKELALVMRRHVRRSDVLARYGGEEFVVIMVSATAAEAFDAIDRLRRLVEAHPFDDEHVFPQGQLTISAGLASAPTDATDYDALVQKADAALYEAKNAGRNRVSTAA